MEYLKALFAGDPPDVRARTVEFHKYQMREMNGLRSSAESIHFAIKHGIVAILIGHRCSNALLSPFP